MASNKFHVKIRDLEINLKQHEKFAQEAAFRFEFKLKPQGQNERRLQLSSTKRNPEPVSVVTPNLEKPFLETAAGGNKRLRTMAASATGVDNGGLFDNLLAEAKQKTSDESVVMDLVTEATVLHFVECFRSKSINTAPVDSKPELENTREFVDDQLFPSFPTKRRSVKDVFVRKPVEFKHLSAGQTSGKRAHAEDGQDNIIKKKMKRANNKHNKQADSPKPEVPASLQREIDRKGGSEVKLVIEKQIFTSDTLRAQDRLTIPVNQIQDMTFLNEQETHLLQVKNETVNVRVLEPCGYESYMKLKQWNLNSSTSIALRSPWHEVLDRNLDVYFSTGDKIQVWSFRVDQQLWLAIINISRIRDSNNNENCNLQ